MFHCPWTKDGGRSNVHGSVEKSMIIRPAIISEVSAITAFLKRYFDERLVLEELPEFGCPMGIRAAVRNREIVIAIEEERIVAALRFYRRKRDIGISLYQFAVAPAFRESRVIDMLLRTLGSDVTAQCPKAAELNAFYRGNGWQLRSSDNRFNYWLWANRLQENISDE
jgi:N-acetylglutamate synthase-like GNAT family acetyltransferase